MPRFRYPFSVIALAAGVAAGGCSSSSADATPPAAGRGSVAAVPVEVAHARSKDMPLDLLVIGTVEPQSTVPVTARITGQLESVNFTEGQEVRKGQVLFTLDRRPLEAAAKQAEAALQRDIAQAANAQVQAQRFVDLQSRGIATREQLETSRANAVALDATVEADRAALENARIQLDYATIVAPLTGRTGSLMVHNGSLVRANDTTPLVVINQLSPINVSFAIPEAQLGELKRYMARGSVPVTITSADLGNTQATGRVSFIDNAVDATTGTIRVKATFDNADHRLWPGQYVNVALTLVTERGAIVVPAAAVQRSQDGQYVYVVKDDQTAEMRPVQVRRTIGGESIIADGVKADEVVVTDGHLRVIPGGKVAVRQSGAGAGAGAAAQ